MQIEIDMLEPVPRAEIADRKHHRLRHELIDGRFGWKDVGDLATNHVLDQLIGGRSLGRHGGDVFAVLEHRDPVGNGKNLFQPVRDENNRHAPIAQRAQRGEEELDLVFIQGGGGFVKNEELRLGDECLGELDKLSLGERKLSCMGAGIDLDLEIVEDAGRFGLDERIVDLAKTGSRHPAQEDIFRHGQVWAEAQLLVNRGNADRFGLVGCQSLIWNAVEGDRARIRLMHPGNQIDPGALAGAVFAHEGVDLTRINIEAHPVEHHIASERLGQVARAQNGRGVERRHWRSGGASGGPGGHDVLDTLCTVNDVPRGASL